MKVGTDGVLLGAWSRVEGTKTILDIGTGTGLIALMLAQRSDAHLMAIELDEMAANQASENVLASPWENRIEVICADFSQFQPALSFDLIVSNPPYFEQSLLSPNVGRTTARHTQSLTYEMLIEKSVSLLNENGRICLIVPSDKEDLLRELAAKNKLFTTRKCNVYPTPNSTSKRLLIEFSLKCMAYEITDLIIEKSRHSYSDDYIKLTKDFYLNM